MHRGSVTPNGIRSIVFAAEGLCQALYATCNCRIRVQVGRQFRFGCRTHETSPVHGGRAVKYPTGGSRLPPHTKKYLLKFSVTAGKSAPDGFAGLDNRHGIYLQQRSRRSQLLHDSEARGRPPIVKAFLP